MAEDSSGPAEKAVYEAYNSLIQTAFKEMVSCFNKVSEMKKEADQTQQQFDYARAAASDKCKAAFKKALEDAGTGLKVALDIIEKNEGKVPKPKHKGEWY